MLGTHSTFGTSRWRGAEVVTAFGADERFIDAGEWTSARTQGGDRLKHQAEAGYAKQSERAECHDVTEATAHAQAK
jgi:hypothetical protein